MKLTYRGTSYNYDAPTVEYGDTLASGKYRGLDIRFRNPKKTPVYNATLDLKYRGANVSASEVTETEVTEAAPVAPAPQPTALVTAVVDSVDNLARGLMLDQARTVKRRQQDMLSRLALEVGVPANEVDHNWSKIQGKLHPTFRVNYSRAGAAMS